MGTPGSQSSGIHGRRREWRTTLDLIRKAKAGRSGVLLVEGGHGLGKSTLLAKAVEAASEQDFSIASGSAEELGQLTPLAPLRAAVTQHGSRADEAPVADVPDARMHLVAWLRSRLEERASVNPLLVSLDDLHWADPSTLLALRTLPRQLASYPLIWIFARCTADRRNDADRLFDILHKDGASRIVLELLDDGAVADLAVDRLGAAPDARLLRLLQGAAGNPLLIVELLEGLKDEHGVSVSEGDARLTAVNLPARIQATVRSHLGGVGPRTRHLLQISAVLGREFALDDAAEMLGEPPAALLPEVEEALGAGLLMATRTAIAFKHDLARQAIAEMLPQPVRQALDRQYGQIILDRGGSAASAAVHLLKGATRGDARVLAGLDRAAAEVMPYSAQTAADLALRALELSPASDRALSARSTMAISALTAAGRLDQAAGLIRTALTRPLPAPTAVSLRCTLSSVLYQSGLAAEARQQADAVLADAGLPAQIRDEGRLALLQALAALRENQLAASLAETVLAARRDHDARILSGALTVLSAIRWDQGRLLEGLRLAHEAVEQVSGGSVESRRLHPRVGLAAMLVDVGRLDDAESVIRASAAEIEALGQAPWVASSTMLRARIALVSGHLDDAAAGAQASVDTANDCGLHMFSPLAVGILATVAMRHGDMQAAARHMERRHMHLYHHAHIAARALHTLITAQIAEHYSGPAAALELAADIYAEIAEHRGPLISDPATAPWLVRVALAAGDHARAAHVAQIADLIARDNPAFPGVVASAAHARGLLNNDQAQIKRASQLHVAPWARASAAEDAGVLLAAKAARRDAIARLDQALAGYGRIGASRDSARVRQRLRRLGVRHRHWASSPRSMTGWASLTDTELAISSAVSQGLTNRAVAKQMFVSENTIAFHLRQIFRKLNINSRVELTRHAIQHGTAPT